MEFQAKILRTQLNLFKPFVTGCSLETARKGQDALGALISSSHKSDVTVDEYEINGFPVAMIHPKDQLSDGIIIYLHGGGYTCGDLTYAKGFGTVLAARCGINVFCPAYRLAPEAIFPAALDDSIAALDHVLSLGYQSSDIILCGESAGGGLIFSVCLELKELGRPMPAGIIGISPWTDLTASGNSYTVNAEVDPLMSQTRLDFYANNYLLGKSEGLEDKGRERLMRVQPLVSPLYGDLSLLPPSLLFVGGDEIMLDDTRLIYEKLLASGCHSQMTVRPSMWHGYVLYCLKENDEDFDKINSFLGMTLLRRKKLRWMRLDNAAKIYPAATTHNWSNLFRVSATLNGEIDMAVMQSALDVTVRRFPSMSVRLRRGIFWYYLEEIPKAPTILNEKSYPVSRMPFDNIRTCAFRVMVYRNRVAVEFFHAITDGNGALIFLKTLVAEYITEKYRIAIPCTDGVFDRLEELDEEELEDSFQKYAGPVNASRREATAFRLNGTKEPDSFLTDTTFIIDAGQIHSKAKEYGVTVTAFLTACAMRAVLRIQEEKQPDIRRRKPVKILIPVNLRKLFPSKSLRNFVLYVTPSVNPKMGEYDFTELCRTVYHQMGNEITPKQMSARIATNVKDERKMLYKIMPLFIKNFAMKAVFKAIGEKKSCFSFSNLGVVNMPEEMRKYVTRIDVVLGVQSTSPYNVGIVTYGEKMYINIIRNITEPLLESHFYQVLHEQGINVLVESNQR